MSLKSPQLGPVLVVGGCGCAGYHVVKLLLQTEGYGPVFVTSRNPTRNLQEGARYLPCDISNADAVAKILEKTKPQVIFHIASPSPTRIISADEYHNTIVVGTENLLKCATMAPSVKALVYTSSTYVYKGHEHINIDETAPMWDPADPKATSYMKSKVLADIKVLQANTLPDSTGHGILTVALRPHLIYGECDHQLVPAQLEQFQAKRTNFQIGNGASKLSVSYAGNVAIAHVLAAQKLLETEMGSVPKAKRVDGEAFLIGDDEPLNFWEFSRMVWRCVGDKTKPEQVIAVPAWLALRMAFIIEWIFRIFTIGQVAPPIQISQLAIGSIVYEFTYNIDKARQRLGFDPMANHEKNARTAVDWELKKNPERWKGIKLV